MRTTITLDDRLERQIKRHAAETGRSFKDVVNELLRVGYEASRTGTAGKPYELEPADLGRPAAGLDLVRALALSDALEDEALVERLRRGA